jgi:hypothetical protein
MRWVIVLVVAGLLSVPVGAQAHHQDAQQNTRLTNLENRVAALESWRGSVTTQINGLLQADQSLDARLDALEAPDPEPTPEPTPTPTPEPTATPTPEPTATPTPTNPQVTLQQMDGGANWFASRGMAEFPIATWGAYNMTQANRDKDADFGVNTYIWVAGGSSDMTALRADSRFRVIQDNSALSAGVGTETKGINLGDEDDMTAADGWCPSLLNQRKTSAGAAGTGRFWNGSYGKGLALPPGDTGTSPLHNQHNWWANTAEANCAANTVDSLTSNIYWFGGRSHEGNTNNANAYGFLYGENIKNMRRAAASDGQPQPTATYVEGGWPFESEGTRRILPDELRSAVWHTIIAGARFVTYFNHSFAGPCTSHHGLTRGECYPDNTAMGKSVNAQIKSLAPVLNSSQVTSGWSKTGDVEASVKWDGQNFYVLAGARRGTTTMNFDMPCIGNANATLLGEGGGTTAVTGGKFSSFFVDKNAVHIYRIDGGNRCGL